MGAFRPAPEESAVRLTDAHLLWLLVAFCLAGLPSVCRAAVPDQFACWGERAREHSYLRPAQVSPLAADAVAATPQETAQGFVFLAAPVTAAIPPAQVMEKAHRAAVLEGRECPGQYGAVSFFLVPLRDMTVSLVPTELRATNGHPLAVENLDVRAVRCIAVGEGADEQTLPLLLEEAGAVRLTAFVPRQFHLTYYVPPGTAAGLHAGTVGVRADGAATGIPLRLRVNPFELAASPCSLYIYCSSPAAASGLEAWRAELTDQRCHGMTMSMIDGPVTREGDLLPGQLDALLEAYAAIGFPEPRFHMDLWNRITSEWLNTPDKSIGMWGPWFRYYPFSAELDTRYVRTVRQIRDAARRRGLELVLAVADEPGSHAWTIPATQHYLDLIKGEVPDVERELTVGGGWAMGEPENELWRGRLDVWTTNRWLPEQLAQVRRDDPEARIQLYNMGGPGSGAGGLQAARVLYGFFNWKAGADGVAQWVYNHSSTPEHNYVWPAEDGRPVPTLRWEAVREGGKDRLYLATLESTLAGREGPVADEARAFLDEIRAKVELRNADWNPIDGGRVPSLPPGTYDAWREQVADLIADLDGGGIGQ
jgi:hypothetical protein